MPIKLNGETGGSVSFDAPDNTSPSGTDVTLTLPTSAGSAGQYLRNSSTAGTLEFGNLPDVGEVVQVKAYMSNHEVAATDSGYIWGSSNGSSPTGSRILFTPVDTSNQLIFHNMLSTGSSNLNGGLQWRINGSNSTDIWMASTDSAYGGGATAYTGAWNTADQSLSAYGVNDVATECVILATKSTYTLPSSIDFGLYFYEGVAGADFYLNRQDSDNGGQGVSTVVVYEVKSA